MSLANTVRERRVDINKELLARETEALKLFHPTTSQLKFFQSQAMVRLIRGANQCLAGEQELYDPMTGQYRRVDEIKDDFYILSIDHKSGATVIAKANRPSIKGWDEILRVNLSNGQSILVTPGHHLLTASENAWLSVDELRQQSVASPLVSTEDTYLSGFPRDVGHSWHRASGFPSDCLTDHHSGDESPLRESENGQDAAPQSAGAHERTRFGYMPDDLDVSRECSPTCPSSSRRASRGVAPSTAGRDDASQNRDGELVYSPLYDHGRFDLQSAEASDHQFRTTTASAQSLLEEHASESPERGQSLNCVHISSIEFVREDFFYDITVPSTGNYILAGVLHHNTGKSLSGFMEDASCATGQPIRLADGSKMPFRYDLNRPRTIWCIGWGEDHVGQTIHRYLFTERHGFKIIQDEFSQEWRAWNPQNEYDREYREKSRDAAPLIPKRFIKRFAWDDKSRDIFSHCELIDGTRIMAFTSGGHPKQGDQVDLIHVDEDIQNPNDVWEWFMRLPKYRGRMTWTVMPQRINNALSKLSNLAEEQKGNEKPDVEEIHLLFRDNDYFDTETKEKTLRLLLAGGGEAAYRQRALGEFTFDTQLVYPDFHPKVHTAIYENEDFDDEISRILRANGGEPPDNWTRYFFLDPGTSVCAGLFVAVPPPDLGEYLICYDEVYQRQSNAERFADECAPKMSSHVFHDFIMDGHGGRQTPMGFGMTVKQVYRNAFAARSLISTKSKNDFHYGSDDIMAGIGQVRTLLARNAEGRPRLRVVKNRTPHLQSEFMQYKMRLRDGEIADEPIQQNNHLMDDLRYCAAYRPQWFQPNKAASRMSGAYLAFQRDRARQKEALVGQQSRTVHMGPGRA